MTRQAFLDAYRAQCIARYDWAVPGSTKLEAFMASVAVTLEGKNTWHCPSTDANSAAALAYRDIGGRGKMTLKALRALTRDISTGEAA